MFSVHIGNHNLLTKGLNFKICASELCFSEIAYFLPWGGSYKSSVCAHNHRNYTKVEGCVWQ